jgi:hypothetical protein
MAGELQIALQVVRDQRKVIDEQDAEIAALKAKLGALEGAIVEKFGAHGVLICQYSDPNPMPNGARPLKPLSPMRSPASAVCRSTRFITYSITSKRHA